jgi:hypothetical protein
MGWLSLSGESRALKLALAAVMAVYVALASWEIGWGGAEVEVDKETGRVTLKKLVVSGDGAVLHRQKTLIRG